MSIHSRFQEGRFLREFSTYGIGGPAKYCMEARDIEDVRQAIFYCNQNKLPYLVVGKGSNCLFDDRGYAGLVIINKISFCNFIDSSVEVGAGYSFSLLGVQTAKKGFSGLEFASGIPATVGGAVYMNAGANGKETCDFLTSVQYVSEEGELLLLKRQELEFGYRFSSFQKRKGAIVGASFLLEPSSLARVQQLEILQYRLRTQPYQDRSAGCVFRNPLPSAAGALIDKCGLKGVTRGGAEISAMHANFIVNKNGATAQDVLDLAHYVKEVVFEKTGVELDMEIRRIPYEG